jgi:hypothetical protein
MFGSESKKEHQQIVDPEGEKCTMFFYRYVMFYSSRVSNPQFQFYESFDSFSLSRA